MSLPLGHHFVPPPDDHGVCQFGLKPLGVCSRTWASHYDSDDIQPIMERAFQESIAHTDQQIRLATPEPVFLPSDPPVFTPLTQQVDVGAETEVLTMLMHDADDQRGTDVPSYLLGASRALLALRRVLKGRQG